MRRNLALVDLETTGLDPEIHEIIEVQVQLCTPDAELRELERFHAYRHPTHPERADPVALRINKYDPETWPAPRGVDRDSEIREGLLRILTGSMLVGVNPDYDEKMIAKFLHIKIDNTEPWYFKQVDVTSLGLPLYLRGQIPDLRTKDLYKHFNIPLGDHTTTGDLKSMKELVRVMLR